MIKKEILNDYLKKELSHNVMFILNIDNNSIKLIEDYLKDNSIDEDTYTYLRDIVNYVSDLLKEINPEIVEEIKKTAVYTGNIDKVFSIIINYADITNINIYPIRSDKDYRYLEHLYNFIKSVVLC